MVPLTIIEAEPLLPAVITSSRSCWPALVCRASPRVPAESVPGLASLTVMPVARWAFAKGSVAFSFRDALAGAVIVGARALTVSATVAEPDLPSFESSTEIDNVSDPAKPAAG